MIRKLGLVFMWELRQRMKQQQLEVRTEHSVELMHGKYEKKLGRLAIQGFAFFLERNKKLRRCLSFLANRNDELKAHAAYIMIKSIFVAQKDRQQREEFEADTNRLKVTNSTIEITEDKIAYMTDRLKKRTETMKERNIIACKLFFTRHIRDYVMSYVDRWRAKIAREKRLMKFADALERKLRTNLAEHSFKQMVRSHYFRLNDELNIKLSKFTSELDSVTNEFNSFAGDADNKIAAMKKESETNIEVAANYKRRLARFNVIRIQWLDRKFGKYFAGQLIKKWKIHVEKERVMLGRLFERLRRISGRLAFGDLTREMKQIAMIERVKRNLHKHLKDSYMHNV